MRVPFLLLLLSLPLSGFGAQAVTVGEFIEADSPPLTSAITVTDPGLEGLDGLDAPTPTVTYNFSREDFNNPVVEIRTSLGAMVLELFPDEAPTTVDTFLGLAEGTRAWTDPVTGEAVMRPFYDGLIFHRVVDGFMIQGGSPTGVGTGTPGFTFADEINARSLGLDKMQLLDEAGHPHPLLAIHDQQDFQQKVLVPLYREMGIDSRDALEANIDAVNRRLRAMSVKDSFENLGYHYTERVISRMPVRGVIAMANSGPDSNGSQFFINLVDTDWLAGKHTVFGKVRVGMEVLDAIGKVPVDARDRPLEDVVILSIRRIDQ